MGWKERKQLQAGEKDFLIHKEMKLHWTVRKILPCDGLCIIKRRNVETHGIEGLLRSKALLRGLGKPGINRWVCPLHRKVEVIYHTKPGSYEE